MTEIKSPVEAVDFTNIKMVADEDSNALFMSRNLIPLSLQLIKKRYRSS